MFNRRLIAASALAIPGFALANQANAQIAPKSRLKAIQDIGTLRIGTTGDFNPMSFRKPGVDGYQGHQIDAGNMLAGDMGVKAVYVPTDWKTLINGLVADQYDIVMSGTSMSAARSMAATFVEPWGRNAFVPLVQRGDTGKFRDWADLNAPGVTIGTNLGTTMEQFVQTQLPKATLRRVESPARDWQELLAGRVDATMSSLIEAASLTREYPQLVPIFADKPRNPIPMAFLIPQGDPIWLAFMNNWMTLRTADGSFAALSGKWGVAGNS